MYSKVISHMYVIYDICVRYDMYICIHVYMCVCVCVYIYIYIYMIEYFAIHQKLTQHCKSTIVQQNK